MHSQYPKPITELLAGIITWPAEHAIQITGIASDNREVVQGDLFISYAGPKSERPTFLADAIKKGAVAILKEADAQDASFEIKNVSDRIVPICSVPNLREKVGYIAAKFFQYPCADMHMIGITGTNGKTTCTQFIARILNTDKKSCGVIGTLGYGFPDDIAAGTLTTPDPITLQYMLSDLKKRDATYIAMEVSSHSLVQHRVAGIPFEMAVFTNLTRDHLDYHGTMENYAAAKRLLFLTPGLRKAIINLDDAFGQQLLAEFETQLDCYAYTTASKTSTVPTTTIKNLHLHHDGLSAYICSPWGEGELHSALLGRFNVSNLLATLTTVCALGLPFEKVMASLSTLATVPGRMQRFGGGKYPLVIVDFAHTPDALEKTLTTLHEHCEQKVWCVFGCGGNRDKGKRPEMARIAEMHSDYVIVTDDNPRFEEPALIMDDILKGFKNPAVVTIEHDRKRAIAYAINHAALGDVILIAGKGHETYQQIGDTKIPFSDAAEVGKIFRI